MMKARAFRVLCLKTIGLVLAALALLAVTAVLAFAVELQHPDRDTLVEDRLLSPKAKADVRALVAMTGKPSPMRAAQRAQELLQAGRRTGDPRTLGYAQAALGDWWGDRNAPIEVRVMQATIEQARHDFDAARTTLKGVLHEDPDHPQGWLTLAAVDLVQGRLEDARNDCAGLVHTDLVTQMICLAQVDAAEGKLDQARVLLGRLTQAGPPALLATANSLLSETEARAGNWHEAEAAARKSLQQDEDHYTRVLLADVLLAEKRPADARRALESAPPTDAVLLRRAIANPDDDIGRAAANELRDRVAIALARGDTVHQRERAMFSLDVEHDDKTALQMAQENWKRQREPVDAWLLARAALVNHNDALLDEVRAWQRHSGVVDARLNSVLKGKHNAHLA